jgi:hypothetical protein
MKKLLTGRVTPFSAGPSMPLVFSSQQFTRIPVSSVVVVLFSAHIAYVIRQLWLPLFWIHNAIFYDSPAFVLRLCTVTRS